MDQSLTELVRSGTVEPDEAFDRALDKESFKAMIATLPKKPVPDPAHVAEWSIAGAGAVAVIAGIVVAGQARDAADRANSAPDLGTWVKAKDEWQQKRTTSGVLLGVGAAAMAAGPTWRFAF